VGSKSYSRNAYTKFSFSNFSTGDNLREFGADVTIIVKEMLERDCEDLNWNKLAHNEVQ
jgi:hypothetical protein